MIDITFNRRFQQKTKQYNETLDKGDKRWYLKLSRNALSLSAMCEKTNVLSYMDLPSKGFELYEIQFKSITNYDEVMSILDIPSKKVYEALPLNAYVKSIIVPWSEFGSDSDADIIQNDPLSDDIDPNLAGPVYRQLWNSAGLCARSSPSTPVTSEPIGAATFGQTIEGNGYNIWCYP